MPISFRDSAVAIAQPVAEVASPGRSADPHALQDGFNLMREAFAATGGMLSADAIASRSELRGGNGIGVVARWIVSRNVVCVHWLGVYWIPAFQFSLPPLRLRDGLADVLVELCSVMDEWCLAHWFATPNGWLAGACPADALATQRSAVWHAARAQRFAICG